MNLRPVQVLAERLASYGFRLQVQEVFQFGKESAQSAGVVEVLHQVLVARRPYVREERGLRRELVEALERELDAGAAGHGDEVDERVGGAAHRHQGDRGVIE